MTDITVNGIRYSEKEAGIRPDDDSILLGTGLFETFPVFAGKPQRLPQHLARMTTSAKTLGLALPAEKKVIAGWVDSYIRSAGVSNAVIRLTLSTGPKENKLPRVIVTARKLPNIAKLRREGYRVSLASGRKNEFSPLVNHKTTSRHELTLLQSQAESLGFDESVMTNSRGDVAEGIYSNIFFIADGELHTPPVTAGLLPGIARNIVIASLKREKIKVHEQTVTINDLIDRADRIFFTNSVRGVIPVREFMDKLLPVTPTPLLRKLQSLFPGS